MNTSQKLTKCVTFSFLLYALLFQTNHYSLLPVSSCVIILWKYKLLYKLWRHPRNCNNASLPPYWFSKILIYHQLYQWTNRNLCTLQVWKSGAYTKHKNSFYKSNTSIFEKSKQYFHNFDFWSDRGNISLEGRMCHVVGGITVVNSCHGYLFLEALLST